MKKKITAISLDMNSNEFSGIFGRLWIFRDNEKMKISTSKWIYNQKDYDRAAAMQRAWAERELKGK